MTERVTLITGASAGIGAELARVFASKGHRVALMARRADRLETLAGEIVAAGGAAPIVIPCDLEQPDSGDRIAAALAAEGVEVEYVVNNAGFGMFGHAIKRDRAEQLGIIAVNIRALTDLSLRFSDQLIRNRGGILNVGFDRRLSAGAGHGGLLRIQGLCAVVHRSAARRTRPARRARDGVVSRAGAVRISGARRLYARIRFRGSERLRRRMSRLAGYRGLMANKRAVMPGLGIKIVPFLLRLFPRGVHPGGGRQASARKR